MSLTTSLANPRRPRRSASASAVRDLTEAQVTNLCEELEAFHELWRPPVPSSNDFWICPSSVGYYQFSPALRRDRPQRIRKLVSASLLYAHCTFAVDPFAVVRPFQFDMSMQSRGLQPYRSESPWRPGRPALEAYESSPNTPRRARRYIAQTLEEILTYRALVEDGAVVLDPTPVGEAWGESMGYPEIALASTSGWERLPTDVLYFDSVLQYAASRSLRFLPDDTSAWTYMQHRIASACEELRAMPDIELMVLPALMAADLPLFTDVAPGTLAAMRRDGADFAAWRTALRNAVRAVGSLPPDDGFAVNARSALEDYIEPAAAELRRNSSRRDRLQHAAHDAVARFILGAVYGSGLGAVTGGSVPSAVAGAAAGVLTTATLSVLYPNRPTGAGAILARIIEGEK
jgi:hypothetical protein